METAKEKKGFVVDGYLFATKEEARIAQKELQGIIYLKNNNNLKDVKVQRQIYHKLLEQGLFRTPIGLNYLKQLQTSISIKDGGQDLTPIPVSMKGMDSRTSINVKKTMLELNDIGGAYKSRFKIALLVIAILIAVIVFMMVVASTTNHPNILNYEEKIIDKYEEWENELDNREKYLNKKNSD